MVYNGLPMVLPKYHKSKWFQSWGAACSKTSHTITNGLPMGYNGLPMDTCQVHAI